MENVWEYPRPPALEPCHRRVRVRLGGVTIADSTRALRVLETTHPPGLYVPPQDIVGGSLTPSTARPTLCEFKGLAVYFDVHGGDAAVAAAAWAYPDPVGAYAALRDHVSFYPGRMDECLLDDEVVRPQEGGFYGGWITADIAGPFKGGAGTLGW